MIEHQQTVAEEPFLGSKTMVLLTITAGLVVSLILLGVAVKVVFDVEVFELVGAGIAALTGQSLGGVWRNTKVDGPIRMAQAGLPSVAYAPPPQPDIMVQEAQEVKT